MALTSLDKVCSRFVGCETSISKKEQPALRTPSIATTVDTDFSKQSGMHSPKRDPASSSCEDNIDDNVSSSAYVSTPSHDCTAWDSGFSRTRCPTSP